MTGGAGGRSRDRQARAERAHEERERAAAQAAHEVTSRAIRRLDILEGVIIGGGAIFALVVGAAVAWVLAGIAGLPFRRTWVVASLLLFVVPGAIATLQIRRDERAVARARAEHTTNER